MSPRRFLYVGCGVCEMAHQHCSSKTKSNKRLTNEQGTSSNWQMGRMHRCNDTIWAVH